MRFVCIFPYGMFFHWYFHWIMFSFGIFSFVILNCFSFVISFPHWIMFSVGIFSCVMLIRQQTCATVGTSYQPAGSYHNYLQPFSRETWANMAHNRKYTLETKFFDNISAKFSHYLIALSVHFCVLPLFSFRLLCKERALYIFPEILSQKGVTDGLSHAFVM